MDHDLINLLYDQAHALPPEQREEFLRSRCQDDGVVRTVLGLFAAAESAPPVLTTPPPYTTLPLPPVPGFRIIRVVGEGGMGVVYEAEEHELKHRRTVALKVIRPELMLSVEARERFRREAATVARLDHPAIVPILRYSETSGPQFIAMKFIEGVTFDAYWRELDQQMTAGVIDEHQRQRKIALGIQRVAEALHHAHGVGVIHRDVKPSNILVDREGRTFLGDFGIAKVADEPALTLTRQNPFTLEYASPEQIDRVRAEVARQAAESQIDARSDVFSLGVILYEALAGSHPFRRANPEGTRDAIRTFDPPSVHRGRSISRRLATIVRIAIEKDRRVRYPTAAHLATDLGRWAAGEPIFGRDLGWMQRTRRWVHANRMRAMSVGVAGLVVATAGLGLALIAQHRGSTARVHVSAAEDRSVAVTSMTLKVARINPSTLDLEPARNQGTLPQTFRLEPGAYRFTALDAKGLGFAETAVVIVRAGDDQDLELRSGPSTPSPDEMARFEGGTFEFGTPDRKGFQRRRTVTVAPFLIDCAEVSNAEYESFVTATGRALPGFWGEWMSAHPGAGRFDPALADHPVVDVSWNDAVAYARWRGKRLPTVFEWEYAMRAGGTRSQPWGEGVPTGIPAVPCEDMQRAGYSNREFQYMAYSKYTIPVRSGAALKSPEGLHHGSSNVQEMVESVSVSSATVRIIKGAGWHQFPQVTTPAETMTLPFESLVADDKRIPDTSMKVGFRCATSLHPPQ